MSERNYFVHESAYVDEPCEIGAGTKIWHFCHVLPAASIGERCILGQNVFVAGGVSDRQQRQDPEQRLALHGRRAGGRCVLRPVLRVHQRHQPALADRPPQPVPAHARAARGHDRRERHDRLRRDDRPLCLHRRRRGRARRRAGLRADGWACPPCARLDEPPRPPAGQRDGDGILVCPESGWRYKEVEPGVLRCLDWSEDEPLPPAKEHGRFNHFSIVQGLRLIMLKTESSTAAVETKTIPVPLLDLKAQYATIRDEVREAMDRVVESQHFILGPEVEALEREVAAYSQCDIRHRRLVGYRRPAGRADGDRPEARRRGRSPRPTPSSPPRAPSPGWAPSRSSWTSTP